MFEELLLWSASSNLGSRKFEKEGSRKFEKTCNFLRKSDDLSDNLQIPVEKLRLLGKLTNSYGKNTTYQKALRFEEGSFYYVLLHVYYVFIFVLMLFH